MVSQRKVNGLCIVFIELAHGWYRDVSMLCPCVVDGFSMYVQGFPVTCDMTVALFNECCMICVYEL